MDHRRVVLRQRALDDIEAAVDWYRDDAGEPVAVRFIDALHDAVRHLGRYPSSGSTRYAVELRIPQLRSWKLQGFPYLLFYADRDTHVDVWRVLHAHRDIPAWMDDPDPSA